MKRIVLLAAFVVLSVVNATGQIREIRQEPNPMDTLGIVRETIAKANQGGGGYKGVVFRGSNPIWLETISLKGVTFYVLQIQSTSIYANKYPFLLGDTYESALQSLNDLVEISRRNVGAIAIVESPDVSKSLEKIFPGVPADVALNRLLDGYYTHRIIVTNPLFESYEGISDREGDAIVFVQTHKRYAGQIGIHRFALKTLIKKFKREMKHRKK